MWPIFIYCTFKQLNQVVRRLVPVTERDGKVSFLMSHYNPLTWWWFIQVNCDKLIHGAPLILVEERFLCRENVWQTTKLHFPSTLQNKELTKATCKSVTIWQFYTNLWLVIFRDWACSLTSIHVLKSNRIELVATLESNRQQMFSHALDVSKWLLFMRIYLSWKDFTVPLITAVWLNFFYSCLESNYLPFMNCTHPLGKL